MPCYEFHCGDCNSQFEKTLPIDQRDNAECPTCGKKPVARLISLPGKAQVKAGRTSVDLPMAGGCGSDNCCGGMCSS